MNTYLYSLPLSFFMSLPNLDIDLKYYTVKIPNRRNVGAPSYLSIIVHGIGSALREIIPVITREVYFSTMDGRKF